VDRTGHVSADSPEIERAGYVVATDGVKVLERPVAEQGGLVLYAVQQPLRVESDVRGGYGDGSFGSIATYDRYASPGGSAGILSVQVSRKVWKGPDKPGHVVVSVGPLGRGPNGTPRPRTVTATRTWTVHSGGSRTLALPTPPPPFAATVAITPTFSPADYGLPDTRQIGAWLSFEFEPFQSRS
jgi:hypothetical protein